MPEQSDRLPLPRKDMPSVKLTREEFAERFLARFTDPAFDPLKPDLERIVDAAWDGYDNSRKAPRTSKAGPGYADPDYDLSIDWLAAKSAIAEAQSHYENPERLPRVLLINASPRSEHTCPGESSKSWRLAQIAKEVFDQGEIAVDLLDLSRTTSEYGRNIYPCKACFSTAAPLCHWPCSCYPNYSLDQTQDWMNEIFPMWVRADGVMVITPVHWYQVSAPFKAMMDRLVCADGGNPDPTLTAGKDAALAKKRELDGWDYPQHLAGRLFGVVAHGDVEGAENVRRSVSDWLTFMGLEVAGNHAELDRYIGYWEPYATSHDALDSDLAIQEEVRHVAATLAEAVRRKREGHWISAGNNLHRPRRK